MQKTDASTIACNPAQSFAIHFVCTLANSVNSAVVARTFRVFIEPGTQAKVSKRARDLTFRAAIHIKARELSAKLRAYKAIAHAVEIIFEVDEPAAQSNIAGEINPVRGKCAGAIAPFS